MADKKPSGGKPKTQKPKPDTGKGIEKLNKNLDKLFGPKKGDGSNRA